MRFTTLTLQDQTLLIDSIGGGIAQYSTNHKASHAIFGYNEATAEAKEAAFGDILSPFPGRVGNSQYVWKGVQYTLKTPLQNGGNALHGFVFARQWNIVKTAEHAAHAQYTLTSEEYAPLGFPFSLQYIIQYELQPAGLKVTAHVKNIGNESAPLGLGFHPYFSVPSFLKEDQNALINDLQLQIPARQLVEFDAQLVPTGKRIPLVQSNQFGFLSTESSSGKKTIGSTLIDNCFTDLIADQNGIATTTLQLPNGGERVEIWQEANKFPYVQVYSFDHSQHGNSRRGIAIETQTCCGFAANYDGLGLLTLEPCQEFSGSWGIRVVTNTK